MGSALTKPDGPVVHRIPQPDKKNESDIYRNILAKDGLVSRVEEEITTLYEAFAYVGCWLPSFASLTASCP